MEREQDGDCREDDCRLNELNDVYLLQGANTGNPKWTCLHSKDLGISSIKGSIPRERNAASAVGYGMHVLIFGGGQYGGDYFNDLHVLTFLPQPLQLFPTTPSEKVHVERIAWTDDSQIDNRDVAFVTFVAGSPREERAAWRLSRSQASLITPVFGAWLSGNWSSSRQSMVTLPTSLSIHAWSLFFDFVATGQLDDSKLGGGQAIELLQLADMFAHESLSEALQLALLPSIDEDFQVVDLLAIARTYSCPLLEEHCRYWIHRHAWLDKRQSVGDGGTFVSKIHQACDTAEMKAIIQKIIDPISALQYLPSKPWQLMRCFAKDA